MSLVESLVVSVAKFKSNPNIPLVLVCYLHCEYRQTETICSTIFLRSSIKSWLLFLRSKMLVECILAVTIILASWIHSFIHLDNLLMFIEYNCRTYQNSLARKWNHRYNALEARRDRALSLFPILLRCGLLNWIHKYLRH